MVRVEHNIDKTADEVWASKFTEIGTVRVRDDTGKLEVGDVINLRTSDWVLFKGCYVSAIGGNHVDVVVD